MNLIRLWIVLLFLSTFGMLGCVGGQKVVMVPESTGLVRLGSDVKGHVYHWNGSEWELSSNSVNLPEGWYAGSLPSHDNSTE